VQGDELVVQMMRQGGRLRLESGRCRPGL